jgi:hypothetical protein
VLRDRHQQHPGKVALVTPGRVAPQLHSSTADSAACVGLVVSPPKFTSTRTAWRWGEGLRADGDADVVGVRRWCDRLGVRRRLAGQYEGCAAEPNHPVVATATAPHCHPTRR